MTSINPPNYLKYGTPYFIPAFNTTNYIEPQGTFSTNLDNKYLSKLKDDTSVHTYTLGGLNTTNISTHSIFTDNFNTDNISTNTLFCKTNAIIGGDLTVNGTTIQINTENVNIEDNMILLNSNFTSGTPLPGFQAGINVNRGSNPQYKFIFNEDDTSFKIGLDSQLQCVATREDNPNNMGIAFWNQLDYKFDTNPTFNFDNETNTLIGEDAFFVDMLINNQLQTNKLLSTGNATFASNLNVSGVATLNNLVANTSTSLFNTTIRSTLNVSGLATMNTLTVNTSASLLNTTIRSSLNVSGATTLNSTLNSGNNIIMNDNAIQLRGSSDFNHCLRTCGNGTNVSPLRFNNINANGPALYGYDGGLLGSTSGGDKALLLWNTNGISVLSSINISGNTAIGNVIPQNKLHVIKDSIAPSIYPNITTFAGLLVESTNACVDLLSDDGGQIASTLRHYQVSGNTIINSWGLTQKTRSATLNKNGLSFYYNQTTPTDPTGTGSIEAFQLSTSGDMTVASSINSISGNFSGSVNITGTTVLNGSSTFLSSVYISGLSIFNNDITALTNITVNNLTVNTSTSLFNTTMNSSLNVSGLATMNTLTVNTSASLFNTTMNSSLNVSGLATMNTLTVNTSASLFTTTIRSTLNVSSLATLNTLTVNGNTTLNNTVNVNLNTSNSVIVSGNDAVGNGRIYNCPLHTKGVNSGIGLNYNTDTGTDYLRSGIQIKSSGETTWRTILDTDAWGGKGASIKFYTYDQSQSANSRLGMTNRLEITNNTTATSLTAGTVEIIGGLSVSDKIYCSGLASLSQSTFLSSINVSGNMNLTNIILNSLPLNGSSVNFNYYADGTMVSNFDTGNFTYSGNASYWTRIGRAIFWNLKFAFSRTSSADTTQVRINNNNIPFNAISGSRNGLSLGWTAGFPTTSQIIVSYDGDGSYMIRFYRLTSLGNPVAINFNELASLGEVQLSGHYFT